MTKIEVDQTLCLGCGMCCSMYPENFDFNENGLSSVINQEGAKKEMMDICPTQAIKVFEDTTSTEEAVKEHTNKTAAVEEKAIEDAVKDTTENTTNKKVETPTNKKVQVSNDEPIEATIPMAEEDNE